MVLSEKFNHILRLVLRLVKYSATTLAGTATDMLVLWVFSHMVFKDNYVGEYIVSPFISFECAVFVNFLCAYFFVWKDRVSERSRVSFLRHYGGYNLSATGAFLVKMAFLLLFERIFGWDVLICNLVALVFSGGLNFFLNEWVVFGKLGGRITKMMYRRKQHPMDPRTEADLDPLPCPPEVEPEVAGNEWTTKQSHNNTIENY